MGTQFIFLEEKKVLCNIMNWTVSELSTWYKTSGDMLQVSGMKDHYTSLAAQVTKCMFLEVPMTILLKSTVQKAGNVGTKYAQIRLFSVLAQLSLASTSQLLLCSVALARTVVTSLT